MTNKPMLGVERELLESFAAYVADSPNAVMRARATKLRALLDKPVNFLTPDCPDCACVQDGQCLCIPSKPAAQHQGDPVAICRLWNEGGSGERTSVEFIGEPCADGTLLYAEQPAPVAVVLPERELYMKYLVGVIPHNASEVNAYKDGWNTCLEEVARLNGVKP